MTKDLIFKFLCPKAGFKPTLKHWLNIPRKLIISDVQSFNSTNFAPPITKNNFQHVRKR